MRTQNLVAVFATMVMLSILVSGTVSAATVLDNALSLSNLSVSPNPVIAGGNATVSFKLYNSYATWVQNVNLGAQGSYPIFNSSLISSLHISQVNPGLNKTYYSYTFKVPAATPSGTYKIFFNATYVALGSSEMVSTSSMPVTFFVQNIPSIKLMPTNPQPATLYLGQNQTITLQINNTGYGTARNVSVDVSAGSGLNLLSSVTSFFISNLTSGSESGKQLLVGARSINGTYLVANVTYYSSRFQHRFSSLQRVNLSVTPSAQFSISSIGNGAAVGATDVPINFRITNTGTSEASELQLTLETTYPVTPIAATAYVNNLQPGASANLTFLVNVDTAGVPGQYPVALYEQWKQPNGAANQQFTGHNNYFVAVVSPNLGASGAVDVIVAIIVIAVLVVVYKKTSAKKRSKSGVQKASKK